MKTGVLTSSSFFGKYVPNQSIVQQSNQKVSAINLKQNFIHERPFSICKFDIPGNRLYLLDSSGCLILLNLSDNSFSTLKGQKIQNFTIDGKKYRNVGNNSLSILYVNNKSELFQVSFKNKKPAKITSLNMNKIRAFERNYLRDMLLSLDYKLLFLCDVNKTGQLNIKSLKAKKDQVFTNACFASNNRFIILVIKNVQIRILQIMNLKSIHDIKLPFVVNDLKIQVSFDSKRIAIYGDCNIIFFINMLQGGAFSYQLVQIPFLKSVVQLRYSCENDIVFLGNDQILYGIASGQPDKAVPLFNQEFHIRTMNFDISLDCAKIALVSNRTVMQLKFPQGLRTQISQKSSFKQLQYRQNGFEIRKNNGDTILQVSQQHQQEDEKNKIQYEDQDGSQQQDNQKDEQSQPKLNVQNIKIPKDIPNYKQQCNPPISFIAQLKGVDSETKAQINSVFSNLITNHKQTVKNNGQVIAKSILKLLKQYKLHPQKCYKVLQFVIESVIKERQRFRNFGLILCPEIVTIVQKKLNKRFVEFCQQQILSLFSNYFIGLQWKQTINWLLSPGVNQKPQNLTVLLICTLEYILQNIQVRGYGQYYMIQNPQQIQVLFNTIYNRVVKTYLDQKYKNLFIKRKVSEIVGQGQSLKNEIDYRANQMRLEQLIIKQDQIKKALQDLKKNKNKYSI